MHIMAYKLKDNSKAKDPNPIYYKLQLELKDKIESRNWIPGDIIPPESKIAKEHNVSLGTIRKAILNLVSDGYLYRIQGKGTIVAGTSNIRGPARYYRLKKSFFEKKALTRKIELLNISKLRGEPKINRLLKIQPHKDLYLLKRRFFFQNSSCVYSISYLVYDMFDSLEKFSRFQFEKIALYALLEEEYGIPTISNRELISAVAADREVAKVLAISPGAPVVKIDMLSQTYKKRPYEYRISYCLTDNRSVLREY
jgi:GntR family transcriptional regulator